LTLFLTALAWIGLALALLYTFITLVNLTIFRAPKARPGAERPVSVLIPARDEERNIRAAVEAALASTGVGLEVVVMDDGSTDRTADIILEMAARDPRVRLVRGAPLPSGWNGKQHACHQLAAQARNEVLLFVDADVRLAPDGIDRMLGYMSARRLDLVSGFPRQITGTLGEKVAIPQILVLLLGYLPFPFARLHGAPGFAAGCGQLMMVTAEAYREAGGHAAFRDRMHDGLNLPRNVRIAGGRTDILDATPIASCRMYDNWADLWSGFSKNATEGMAKPVALPIWTVLLSGGHHLPWITWLLGWLADAPGVVALSLWAIGLVYLARLAMALKLRQPLISVLLHPVGVGITLAIQWAALRSARLGRRAVWRGRAYDVN
jgi:cellulose synthase/poly-beta-1,6-N-acetylglucosamine synthase-like glycosyltransferase